jgi:hypothetical protein
MGTMEGRHPKLQPGAHLCKQPVMVINWTASGNELLEFTKKGER